MGVLCSVVHVSLLGKLVNEEPDEDSDHESLPECTREHVQCLIVDPVELLESLQVILLSWRVCDRPQAQIVHMAKHGPTVLEGNPLSTFLALDMLI